jgi:hypothetical protein
MKAKKFFGLLILFVIFLFSLTSCVGGEELCRIDGKEYSFALFGGANGISRVDIYLGSEKSGSVKPDYRVNEPWLGEDKEDYGFRVLDIDGDGDEDFIIKSVRTEGAEKYRCFINKDGEFVLEKKISALVSPIFEDGTVRVETFERFNEPTYTNEPPMYELRRDEILYGFTEHGRFVIKQISRFSYFSETDIYRFSILIPDEEGELYADSDKWIYPEDLEKYGFEPLE